METCFQNEGFHQYLILETEQADVDSFEWKMLMRYEGKRLLPLKLEYRDGSVSASYDITGATSIQDYFSSREMNAENLKVLFQAVHDCYGELEEYLLPVEGCLLKPECIYYQPGKKQFFFCYCPELSSVVQEEFRTLAEFCMRHTLHQDSEAVLFIYGLYRLLQEGGIEEKALQQYLEGAFVEAEPEAREEGAERKKQEKRGEQKNREESISAAIGNRAKPAVKRRPLQLYSYTVLSVVSLSTVFIFGIRFLFITHREHDLKFCIISAVVMIFCLYSMLRSKNSNFISEKSESEKSESGNIAFGKTIFGKTAFGKTVSEESVTEEVVSPSDSLREGAVIEASRNACVIEMGETEVLQVSEVKENMAGTHVLWVLESRPNNGMNIQLNHLPGVLGREFKDVDYIISGEGVSRRHLMLFQSGEELYVEDLSSTNGTYINGVRLKAGEPVELCDGDRLSVGPSQYQVRKENH